MTNPYTHQPMLVLLALKKSVGNDVVKAREAVRCARTYIGNKPGYPAQKQAEYDAIAAKYAQIQAAIADNTK